MKIIREVNGMSMEFELTEDERFSAYEEQEHAWDVKYITNTFVEERFDDLSDEERESAYNEIAYAFREKLNKMEHPDSYEAALKAVDEFFEQYEFNNVWICVYKDALGYEDDFDNLTEILVSVDWLKNALVAEGVNDYEDWLDEYTADSTDYIARAAVAQGVILKCTDEKVSNFLGLGANAMNTVEKTVADAVERSAQQVNEKNNKEIDLDM